MEISLAVALALILTAVISFELKLSSAVLEVLAGMALGALIADIHTVDWLHYLANIGVLALMFVAGFELQIRQLRKRWQPSVSIGITSFVFPFSGIYALMHYWVGLDMIPSALIATGLSTTSLALVYHSLKERHILQSEPGQIMFGAASIVDIISMVFLAILLGEMGWGTALFGAIFVVVIFIMPRFANWVFKRYPGSLAEPELRFLMVILVGMAFMAESVGHVHPALVAFTLGVFMSRFIERNKVVKDKLMALVFSFFAPLFFLYSGTKIDVSALTEDYFVILAVVFVAAIGLKFLGTYLPSLYFINGESKTAGIIFNYRLSFRIITANVGLETGMITPNMFAVIMLVIVGSAALPSLLIRKPSVPAVEVGRQDAPVHEESADASTI